MDKRTDIRDAKGVITGDHGTINDNRNILNLTQIYIINDADNPTYDYKLQSPKPVAKTEEIEIETAIAYFDRKKLLREIDTLLTNRHFSQVFIQGQSLDWTSGFWRRLQCQYEEAETLKVDWPELMNLSNEEYHANCWKQICENFDIAGVSGCDVQAYQQAIRRNLKKLVGIDKKVIIHYDLGNISWGTQNKKLLFDHCYAWQQMQGELPPVCLLFSLDIPKKWGLSDKNSQIPACCDQAFRQQFKDAIFAQLGKVHQQDISDWITTLKQLKPDVHCNQWWITLETRMKRRFSWFRRSVYHFHLYEKSKEDGEFINALKLPEK